MSSGLPYLLLKLAVVRVGVMRKGIPFPLPGMIAGGMVTKTLVISRRLTGGIMWALDSLGSLAGGLIQETRMLGQSSAVVRVIGGLIQVTRMLGLSSGVKASGTLAGDLTTRKLRTLVTSGMKLAKMVRSFVRRVRLFLLVMEIITGPGDPLKVEEEENLFIASQHQTSRVQPFLTAGGVEKTLLSFQLGVEG